MAERYCCYYCINVHFQIQANSGSTDIVLSRLKLVNDVLLTIHDLIAAQITLSWCSRSLLVLSFMFLYVLALGPWVWPNSWERGLCQALAGALAQNAEGQAGLEQAMANMPQYGVLQFATCIQSVTHRLQQFWLIALKLKVLDFWVTAITFACCKRTVQLIFAWLDLNCRKVFAGRSAH
eukprot:119227-Amphidinium_carterae.2